MKTVIEVEISNVEVDSEYYSFDYIITVNSKKRKKENYSNDYQNGCTPKEWKKELERGYAVECALQDFEI